MNQWIRLPLELLQREDLTTLDAVIWAIVCDAEGHRMTQGDIAAIAGCSRKAVNESITRLTNAQLITASDQHGRGACYSVAAVLPPIRRSKRTQAQRQEHSYDLNEIKELMRRSGQ